MVSGRRKSEWKPVEAFKAERVQAPLPARVHHHDRGGAFRNLVLGMAVGECHDVNRKVDSVKSILYQLRRRLDFSSRIVVRPSPDREGWSRIWRVE